MTDEMSAAIARVTERGQARWPQFVLGSDGFTEHVRAHAIGLSSAEIDKLHAEDLFLAFACVCRDPAALQEFRRHVTARLPTFVGKLRLTNVAMAEVEQEVLIKLLVGEDGLPPRLAQYKGRGTLDAWVCAVCLHAALVWHRRAGGDRLELHEDLDEVLVEADASLAVARRQFAGLLGPILRDVLLGLSARERLLLRMYYVEELSLRQLGRIHGVNASTVMRQIDAVLERIAADMKAALRRQIALSSAELQSLGLLLDAQLTLSLLRILGGSSPQ
jgi:RNA polymerase sigma-70 factor (ECF subfamily)